MLRQYRQLVAEAEPGISSLGRPGTYRYLDMDQEIGEALDLAVSFLQAIKTKKRAPVFTGEVS